MKRYRITLEGHTYDVEVLDDPRQRQVRVRVDGEVLTVEAEAALDVGGTSPAPVSSAASPLVAPAGAAAGVVKAPLPGVIKSIAVSPGERVAAGDELLVIEAMKMNNVIRAPRGGTVSFIYVSEGRQVPHGEPLLRLQEEP